MAEQKLTPEEAFRSSLEDLIAVAEKLAPYCGSVEELVEVCQLAVGNAAQAKLLLEKVSGGQSRR